MEKIREQLKIMDDIIVGYLTERLEKLEAMNNAMNEEIKDTMNMLKQIKEKKTLNGKP